MVGGLALLSALIIGLGLGRFMVQQQQNIQGEAVKGGRKGLTGDDVYEENGKYYVKTDAGKSLLKKDDDLVKDYKAKRKIEDEERVPNVTDGDVIDQIAGRTIYVLKKDGSKLVVSIKNDATYDAMRRAANRDGVSVQAKFEDVSTMEEFNKIVNEEIVRQSVYKKYDQGETITYQVCVDGEAGDSSCNGGHWETRTFASADEAWSHISQSLVNLSSDQNPVNIYYCASGLVNNVCNDNELLTMDQNELFYALTGSGKLGESLAGLCGGFQVDVGMSSWSDAGVGDSSLSFSIPCGDGSGEEKTNQSYRCVNLDAAVGAVELGDVVEFACQANFSGYSPLAYFRYSNDLGLNWTYEDLAHDLTASNPATTTLAIDSAGGWVVQCQVCTDQAQVNCTPWDQVPTEITQ